MNTTTIQFCKVCKANTPHENGRCRRDPESSFARRYARRRGPKSAWVKQSQAAHRRANKKKKS